MNYYTIMILLIYTKHKHTHTQDTHRLNGIKFNKCAYIPTYLDARYRYYLLIQFIRFSYPINRCIPSTVVHPPIKAYTLLLIIATTYIHTCSHIQPKINLPTLLSHTIYISFLAYASLIKAAIFCSFVSLI